MYIYSVSININKAAEDEWLEFMTTKHIKDVLATGYLTKGSMRKEVINEESEFSAYSIEYTVNTKEAFDAYQEKAAPSLQKDVSDRFAGKFNAKRSFYKVIFEA